MGKTKIVILDEQQKADLEKGWRESGNHTFRQRCQLILLKAESRDSSEVGAIVKMCEMTVNNWVNRYKNAGIEGLKTKPGRGRKPILDKVQDQESILKFVKENRQRVATAQAEWEAENADKKVNRETFRRFLKALAAGTNEFAADAKGNPMQNSINSK